MILCDNNAVLWCWCARSNAQCCLSFHSNLSSIVKLKQAHSPSEALTVYISAIKNHLLALARNWQVDLTAFSSILNLNQIYLYAFVHMCTNQLGYQYILMWHSIQFGLMHILKRFHFLLANGRSFRSFIDNLYALNRM